MGALATAVAGAVISALGEILFGWIKLRNDAAAASDKARADQSTETKDVIQEIADAQSRLNARVATPHDVAEWLRSDG